MDFYGIDLNKAFRKYNYYYQVIEENRVKTLIKLLYTFIKSLLQTIATHKKSFPNIPNDARGKHVFFVNSIQQIKFWEKTHEKLGRNNTLFIIETEVLKQDIADKITTYCNERRISSLLYNLRGFYSPNRSKHLNGIITEFKKIICSKEPLFEKNKRLVFYIRAINLIDSYTNLGNLLKPRSVVLLASEVNPFAHLITQVIHKIGGKVINSMNGLKNEDLRNADTNFDAWLIWSEAQYELLTNKINTPSKQLFITGHLHADNIHDFKKEPINLNLDTQNFEKVIVFFSQPPVQGNQQTRESFLKTINDFLNANPKYFGILKLHPREYYDTILNYIDLKAPNIKVFFDEETHNKSTLYSLIYSADYVIVMYSTVTVEALFLEKPVFSFCLNHLKDPLPIPSKVVPRFSTIDELKALLKDYKELSQSQRELLDYEIGKCDGLNYKRAVDVINEVAK